MLFLNNNIKHKNEHHCNGQTDTTMMGSYETKFLWTRDMLVDQGGKKLHFFWILLAQGIICLLNIFYNFEFEIT